MKGPPSSTGLGRLPTDFNSGPRPKTHWVGGSLPHELCTSVRQKGRPVVAFGGFNTKRRNPSLTKTFQVDAQVRRQRHRLPDLPAFHRPLSVRPTMDLASAHIDDSSSGANSDQEAPVTRCWRLSLNHVRDVEPEWVAWRGFFSVWSGTATASSSLHGPNCPDLHPGALAPIYSHPSASLTQHFKPRGQHG